MELSFIGREKELALIQTAFDGLDTKATKRRVDTLAFTGVAGVGKSRLVHEATKRIREADPQTTIIEVDTRRIQPGTDLSYSSRIISEQIVGNGDILGVLERGAIDYLSDQQAFIGEASYENDTTFLIRLGNLIADLGHSRRVIFVLDNYEHTAEGGLRPRIDRTLLRPAAEDPESQVMRLITTRDLPLNVRYWSHGIRFYAQTVELGPIPHAEWMGSYLYEQTSRLEAFFQLTDGNPLVTRAIMQHLGTEELVDLTPYAQLGAAELAQEMILKESGLGAYLDQFSQGFSDAVIVSRFVDVDQMMFLDPELSATNALLTAKRWMSAAPSTLYWDEEDLSYKIDQHIQKILVRTLRLLDRTRYDKAHTAAASFYKSSLEGRKITSSKLTARYWREYLYHSLAVYNGNLPIADFYAQLKELGTQGLYREFPGLPGMPEVYAELFTDPLHNDPDIQYLLK